MEKKPILRMLVNKYPAYLIMFITARCNSKCKYCFYKDQLNTNKKELGAGEIDKISRSFKDLIYVSLTGGEPFIREDIDRICLSFYKNSGTRFIAIPTNGLLNEKIVEKTKKILEDCPKLNLSIDLSVDAIGEKHDEIRGVKGNFDKILKVIEGLKNLKNKRLKIIIHTVFSVYNQDNVLELYEYFRDRVDQHRIGFLREDSPEKTKVDIEKYDFVMSKIKREKKGDFYSKLFITINEMNNEINVKTVKENRCVLPCVAGRKMIVIGEEGDVYPCEILNRSMGNLRKYNYDIMKLLNSYDAKSIRRFIVKHKCFCSWGCATQNNIIFNFRTYPKLLYRFLK